MGGRPAGGPRSQRLRLGPGHRRACSIFTATTHELRALLRPTAFLRADWRNGTSVSSSFITRDGTITAVCPKAFATRPAKQIRPVPRLFQILKREGCLKIQSWY